MNLSQLFLLFLYYFQVQITRISSGFVPAWISSEKNTWNAHYYGNN